MFGTMCNKQQERAKGLKDIYEVFWFLISENLQKQKEHDLNILTEK